MTGTENDMPCDDTLRAALRRVIDPEAGMNIVDLGLVYVIDVAPTRVCIVMTMTTPACPMSAMIMDEVRREARTVTPVDAEIDIQLVWEPPWNAGMLSARAKEHFGW